MSIELLEQEQPLLTGSYSGPANAEELDLDALNYL